MHVAFVRLSLLFCVLPLCECSTVYLSILQSIDISVVANCSVILCSAVKQICMDFLKCMANISPACGSQKGLTGCLLIDNIYVTRYWVIVLKIATSVHIPIDSGSHFHKSLLYLEISLSNFCHSNEYEMAFIFISSVMVELSYFLIFSGCSYFLFCDLLNHK